MIAQSIHGGASATALESSRDNSDVLAETLHKIFSASEFCIVVFVFMFVCLYT